MSQSKSQSTGLLASMGDLFGKPVYLNLRRQQAVSTSLGGLLSLILILIMIAQGVLAILQMTKRQQPQILQLNEVIQDPPNVSLNQSNNFNFAFSTTVNGNPVNMTNSSLLTLTAASTLYLRNETNITKYQYEIGFAPCDSSDFSDSIFGEGTYDLYQISYAYCPRNISYLLPNGTCPQLIEEIYPTCVSPPVFNLTGSYLSPTFSFIQFNFSLCDNTNSASSTSNSNMECMDLSDIYSIFNNDTEVKVNFYFANNLINPLVFETPNETYLDLLFWDVNPRLSKISDIFLDEEIVQDYASYYSSGEYANQSFYSIDSSHLREQQSYLFENWTNQSLLTFNVRRNVLNSVTTRVYMKIQDVMADLGGLAKSIMAAFAFIAVGYAMFKYQMVVSNELYDFEPVDDNDSPKNKRPGKNNMQEMSRLEKSMTENSLSESMISRDSVDSMSKIDDHEEEKEKVKSYFRYQQKKQRRLKYNEFVYLKSLLCCRRQKPEETLAVKSRNQVEEDVDLIQILQKLKEVDKLKILLLDRNQRELFDYIPKPLLTREGDQPLNSSFDLSFIGPDPDAERDMRGTVQQPSLFDSLPKYAKLYVSYRNAKDNKDPLKQSHNRKLLTMLGPDLIRVFEHVDKELGNQADPDLFEAIIKRYMNEDHSHRTLNVEL